MRKLAIRFFISLIAVMACSIMTADVAHASAGTAAPAAAQKKAATGETKKTEGAADKEAMLALAKKSGCLACHAMDKKLVGPSWADVAARYKGDAKAKATLIEKVKKGSKGNWTKVTGGVPMPPNSPKVPDADIEKLVNFVLSMAK